VPRHQPCPSAVIGRGTSDKDLAFLVQVESIHSENAVEPRVFSETLRFRSLQGQERQAGDLTAAAVSIPSERPPGAIAVDLWRQPQLTEIVLPWIDRVGRQAWGLPLEKK
jgi:hypothetical protein